MNCRGLHVLLVCICIASTSVAQQRTAQDRFDDAVGYAYGYSLSISRMAQRCQELFPEFATELQTELDKWATRNLDALREIDLQWRAYIERDAAVAKLPQERYSAEIEKAAQASLSASFEKLGGEASTFARSHCQNYPYATLRNPKLFLEARLQSELDAFRSCQATKTCKNIVRAPQ